MRKASAKDILRTVWKEKKRFISIMMITVLGVTMMTGIEAGCRDLKLSADKFYDSQKLFDISVMSTLGLTQDDVIEIRAMDGVERAEGTFSEIVHTKNKDVNKTAEMKIYQKGGLNVPYVIEGRLPETENEIVVSGIYLKDTGKKIGDSLVIEEIMDEDSDENTEETTNSDSENNTDEDLESDTDIDNNKNAKEDGMKNSEDEIDIDMDSEVELEEKETPNFPHTEFVIVGTIIDVMDINNAEGSASFRATPNADYTFFVIPEAVESEVYTAVYVSLEGSNELLCYSDEYEEKVESFTARIEAEIMEQRELVRYQEITEEAYEKIAEKEEEMYETFADIEQEFSDAWEEISDGWTELLDGKQELTQKEHEAKEEIADARKELEDAYKKLDEAWGVLNEAEGQLNAGVAQLEDAKEELREKEKKALQQLEDGEALLLGKIAETNTGLKQLEDQLGQMKLLFTGAWTDENLDSNFGADGQLIQPVSTKIEPAWNDYIGAAMQVIAPVIANQMNTENSQTEVDLELLMELISQDTKVSNLSTILSGVLIGNLDTVIGNLTTQKNILEAQKLELNNQITNLENLAPEDTTQIELLKESLLEVEKAITAIAEQIMFYQAVKTSGNQQQVYITNAISLATGIAATTATSKVLEEAMEEFEKQKEYALSQIEGGWDQIRTAERELEEARDELSYGRGQVIDNYQKWKDGVKELDESEQEALLEIAEAWDEIAEGEQELIDGEIELKEHEVEYQDARVDAEEKIAEAKQEVADIDMTKWYVQDRTSLSGYVNVDSDTSCIESLSTVFTIVFFVVAILISLTTVTRMVEEERGLIGTYKALGFTDGEIRRKYVVYAAGASILGAIIGDVGGFVILPEILFVFFRVMYVLPTYILRFEAVKGAIAGLLFVVGIVGAALVACQSELKHVPAQLMRPKAPKEGSRVFLEYIKPLWKRMSFLNKVTARNLFRYKKRMFMTLFGIMGCTALLVFGLAIKDSVDALMPLQYDTVYNYDLLAATSATDNDKLVTYMQENSEVLEYLNIQVETVKLKNDNKQSEKVQIMVFPNGADISKYLALTNENLEPITIGNCGIYLTENASRILNLKVGDTAFIQKLDLAQEQVQITSIVKNYLGNNIYMSQVAYEEVFGTYEPNGILANLSESCTDQIDFSESLASEDWIISSVSTQELKDTFSQAFTLINLVVYVVLVLAACLAFVVLFTLASINISERERELATIKVLGFYDKEVHSYVNKETIILTIMGILIGLPVGNLLSSTLTDLLNMPSIYFAITIYRRSYLIAAGIALIFAFMVQFLTDRSLDVIDPVEALKSVE